MKHLATAFLALSLAACGGGDENDEPPLGSATAVDVGAGDTFILASYTFKTPVTCNASVRAGFWSNTNARGQWLGLGYGTVIVIDGADYGKFSTFAEKPTIGSASHSWVAVANKVYRVELQGIAPEGHSTQWGDVWMDAPRCD